MTAVQGANALIGLNITSTWGTASQALSGDKLVVDSFTHGENAEELTENPIGGGLVMANSSERGAISPTVSFTKKLSVNDAGVEALALIFGSASVVAVGGSIYHHSISMNAYQDVNNTRWATIAAQASDGAVYEYPSAAPVSLTISGQPRPDFVLQTMEFLANKQELATSVNTVANLGSTTLPTTDKFIFRDTSYFMINAQAGAALSSSSDVLNITDFTFVVDRSRDHVREAKNAAGLGVPVAAGEMPVGVTFSVTLRNLNDLTYFTAHQAGTEYKGALYIAGVTAGHYFRIDLPRLKLVVSPDHQWAQTGDNPVVLTFKCLVASVAPTGMTSVYPYVSVRNAKSSAYLAVP